ncbi:MAG TPA: alanyl-tRNA editing protein, partial [Oribacterium sp.]|nr:alanyl-tRNA editing protein [Oribacterium sp.]
TALWPTPEELEAMDYRSKKPLSGDVRIVDLGGADLCACCGTHVQRTGEIGPIKILSMISHKGGVRL